MKNHLTSRRTLLRQGAGVAVSAATATWLTGCATPALPPTTLRLGTAAPGGGFNDFGIAMVKVFEEVNSPIKLQMVPSSGTIQNMQFLRANQLDISLAVMGPAYDVWQGSGVWKDPPMKNLRALCPMFETGFHLALPSDSTVNSLSDLRGKRIGAGPVNGTAEIFLKGLMEQMGLQAQLVYASPNDNADQLTRKEIDAFWFGAGLPVPAFVRAANSGPIRIIGLIAAEQTALKTKFPFFTPFTISPNTYKGQTTAISTSAVWNFVVTNELLPARVAQVFVQTMLDNRDRLTKLYAAGSGVRASNAFGNTFMPFHPAAAEVLKKAGGTIQAGLG
jgi:uncharacterized protein